jgi:hypothetical protein
LNEADSSEENLGKAITYLTNTLTKLETGSKLTPDKELGIKGFYLTGILIKSRNTEAGTQFKMVFEQSKGINNLLTNFVNLKDLKRISGAGRSFHLDTLPDVKFSLKEFAEKYRTNEKLRKAFDEAVDEEYSKFLPDEFDSAYNGNISAESDKEEDEVIRINEDGMIIIDEEEDIYKDPEDGTYYTIEEDEYVEIEYEE